MLTTDLVWCIVYAEGEATQRHTVVSAAVILVCLKVCPLILVTSHELLSADHLKKQK